MAAQTKKTVLKHDHAWYTPSHTLSKGVSSSELRAEYKRLRDVARHRLRSFETSEGGYWKGSESHMQLKEAYQGGAMRGLSDEEIAMKLSDLSRMLSYYQSSVSTLRAQRDQALESLQQSGYAFVTKENYKDFGEFMQEYREKKLDRIYDSGDAAETYRVIRDKGLTLKSIRRDFEFWIENHDVLDNMTMSKGKSAHGAAAYRKRINRGIR